MPRYIDASSSTANVVTAKRLLPRAGIVLHSTEGTNSLPWLQGGSAAEGKPASADFLLPRNGDVVQITAPSYYSYHVGIAKWRHVSNDHNRLNMLLVGIEFESAGGNVPRYTDEQLVSGAWLVRCLWAFHRLTLLDLVGHYEIALPPGRRSDPVAFPKWTFANEVLAPSPPPHGLVFPSRLP